MKKYINLSWFLLVVLGLASCEAEDDYLETKEIGGYAVLSDKSISVFDTNEDLTIDFFTSEGVTAESVEILQRPNSDSPFEVVGSGTVSGGTATFNTSILGNLKVGSYPIRIRTTYSNGNVSEDPFTLSVSNAIVLGDNPSTTNMDDLDAVTLAYDLSTFNADVDEVTLLLKENKNGTYADSGVTLTTESGTVDLSETNYGEFNLTEGDILYYQFVATSGSMTEEVEGTLAITAKAFETTNSVTLSSDPTMDHLNMATGEVTADEGDIAYLDPTGFMVVNDADVDFVQVSDTYFDDVSMDVINARTAYMEGTPATSFTDVENGDTFVYQATRVIEDAEGETEIITVYGVLQIGSVTTVTVDGEQVVAFEISYSEGM